MFFLFYLELYRPWAWQCLLRRGRLCNFHRYLCWVINVYRLARLTLFFRLLVRLEIRRLSCYRILVLRMCLLCFRRFLRIRWRARRNLFFIYLLLLLLRICIMYFFRLLGFFVAFFRIQVHRCLIRMILYPWILFLELITRDLSLIMLVRFFHCSRLMCSDFL